MKLVKDLLISQGYGVKLDIRQEKGRIFKKVEPVGIYNKHNIPNWIANSPYTKFEISKDEDGYKTMTIYLSY